MEIGWQDMLEVGSLEDFGDHSEVIVARLKAERRLRKVLASFARLRDHESRLRYVHALLKQLDLFLPLRPDDDDDLKSKHYSLEKRLKGNEVFAMGAYELALGFYHMAVAAAPPASVELTLSFSNRSAVFFRTKQYQKCLVDIELALAGTGCDDKLRDKLTARREQCRQLMTADPEREILTAKCHGMFTFPHGTNPEIPCTTGSISLDATSHNIIACRDINPGELVALEQIQNSRHHFGDMSKVLSECYQCHNEGVISCDDCKYLFCLDEHCQSDVKKIHKYECALSNTLHNEDIYSLRTVLKGLDEYGSVENLRAAIESLPPRDASKRGFRKVGDRDSQIDVFDSSHFLSFYTHRTYWNKETTERQFMATVNIACILQGVAQLPALFSDWVKPGMNCKDSHLWFMGKVLLHLKFANTPFMICRDRFVTSPFLGLLKHSCSPNVLVTHSDRCLAFVAILPIKKGKEILACYNDYYEDSPLDERQQGLLKDYHFVCKCKACTELWPVSANLCPVSNKVKKVDLKPSEYGVLDFLIRSGNKKMVLELFPKICSDITLFYPYEPCQEISRLKHLLHSCIFTLRDSYNLCKEKPEYFFTSK